MRASLLVCAPLIAACATKPASQDVEVPARAKPARSSASLLQVGFVESFFGTIPVKHSEGVPDGVVDISVVGFSGSDYGELGRRAGAAQGPNGRIRVAFEKLTNAVDPITPQHKKCSFLIDCDEPSVVAVVAEAKLKLGERPSVSQLVEFVAGYVTNKSLERGQDLPSQTAVSRTGDCTEHALLFVALARRFEYAARDIGGYVLIGPKGEVLRNAFGHAWAEVHDGTFWRRVDPALGLGLSSESRDPVTFVAPLRVDEAGKRSDYELSYVPLRVRGEEGPSYERDEMKGLNVAHVDALWMHAQGSSSE